MKITTEKQFQVDYHCPVCQDGAGGSCILRMTHAGLLKVSLILCWFATSCFTGN